MKRLLFSLVFLIGFTANANDTLFWIYAETLEIGEIGRLDHDWGHESIKYVGTVSWRSPSGAMKDIRIVTSYRQLTRANGFNDQNILALVKDDHQLIKTYDMVNRKNLPISIRDNQLVYDTAGGEVVAALPAKLGARFCVSGLTCFDEIHLHHGH